MDFFGIFGASDNASNIVALNTYGDKSVAATGPKTEISGHGTVGIVWAPDTNLADGILASIRGQPLQLADNDRTWTAISNPCQTIRQLYVQRGDRFLEVLGGRFSIAIVDTRRRRCLLAVDRMGIERMTYGLCDDMLAFSSSAEAVARVPGRVARIDSNAIFDYLMLHMVPSPGTIYQGVRKLQPGHCVAFEHGSLRVSRYWNQRFIESGQASFDTLKAELHDGLRAAVRESHPGASSGAFLSGGLDSSTVAGVLSEVATGPVRTFTIGFGYPDYDETRYSRAANVCFGCERHEYVVTGEDIADGFPLIARAYDEPFGNSSALPVYYCARLARETGVDHLLAGDGGDELFAGNSRYAEQQVFERYQHLPRFVRQGMIEPVLRAWPDALAFWLVRKGRGYVEKSNVPLPERLEMWNLLHRVGTSEMLHPDFRAAIDEGGTLAHMRDLWNSAPAEGTLGHMLYYDWQFTLADNDLRKVETMSALAGVRVSYPMLHPDVVDLAMRVPPGMMMPGTKLRDFYKRAMTGFLPDEIIHKKKHGFGLPFGLWLQETPRLRAQIDGNLESLRSRRIIRSEFIDRLLQLHGKEDAKYYGVFIWVLAMLEQWLQEHRLSV